MDKQTKNADSTAKRLADYVKSLKDYGKKQ